MTIERAINTTTGRGRRLPGSVEPVGDATAAERPRVGGSAAQHGGSAGRVEQLGHDTGRTERVPGGPGRVEQLDDARPLQPDLGFEGLNQIPHDCAPETLPADPPRSAGRLIGIDVARAMAIVGMIAVHVLPMTARDGSMSLAFVLSAGKSSALFAVLAGVGIALSTGRTSRPTGRRWPASMAEVAVRAVLLAVLGLALGYIVPAENADVILLYYGVLFLLAVPLLRLPVPALATLAAVIAIGVPLLSHGLRSSLPPAPVLNPSFTTLVQHPGLTMEMIFLTGAFPALGWMAYVCAGMAIGRAALGERQLMIRLAVIGITLAVAANVASWFFLTVLGGRDKLAAIAAQTMTLEEFTDLLVWGGEGVLPTTSPWWLAVLAPHTTTPVDIVFTLGIAVAVIGVALILGVVAPGALRPIASVGSMPLSLYVGHLLLLSVPFMPEQGWLLFILHLIILTVFALVWRIFFKRGPLELALGWAAHRVGALVVGSSAQQRVGQ